jgi:parvulin-like peptidyl-prolyl isomerase
MIPTVVLTMFLASMNAGAAPLELARVNGEPITDGDLKAAFVGKHGGHTAFLGGEAEARRFLDIVIDERLLIQEAYNLGLDADPSVKPKVDEFRDRKCSDYLAKQEFEQKAAPSKEEIREAWQKAGDLFLASEIVLDTKAEAEAIRRSLMGGAEFEPLARACSIAPSKSRGGSIPPFTWGSLSPEIEEAAAMLEPGQISPVIHRPEGWTILVLIDKVPAQRPELDERVSQRIEARLRERRLETLTTAFAEFLWKSYGAEITLSDRGVSSLASLLRSRPDTVVAKWTGGELKVSDAFSPGEVRMFGAFLPGRAAEKIDSTLRSAVNTQLIRLEAKRRGVSELPEVAGEVDRFEARLVESALYDKHVLTAVKVADEEIRAAYEAQKSSLIVPEKRRVAHIGVAAEKDAVELRKRIDNGEDFADLVKKHSLDKGTNKIEGDLGWIVKGRVEETWDPIFALPVGGVTQPIESKDSGSWHLVKVTAIETEHPLSFEEAKEKIGKQLLEKKKHDARKFWIAKLREASEIVILDEGVRAFVAANPMK